MPGSGLPLSSLLEKGGGQVALGEGGRTVVLPSMLDPSQCLLDGLRQSLVG